MIVSKAIWWPISAFREVTFSIAFHTGFSAGCTTPTVSRRTLRRFRRMFCRWLLNPVCVDNGNTRLHALNGGPWLHNAFRAIRLAGFGSLLRLRTASYIGAGGAA